MTSLSQMFTGTRPALRDWEKQDKLNVELIGYGWQEKRVMVRVHLPKDRDTARIQRALLALGRDVKHSKDWTCEYCGAPSRETHVQTLSWQHLDPPRFVLYIHYVCDMDAPHVRAGIKANEDMFNMVNGMTGLGPTTTQIPDKEPGVTFPLAGGCAGCERDSTAGGRADLKKCSGCKLTRYCGAECQKRDWPRHKVTCGKIYSVNFENWE